ncbi:acyltransferase [Pseudomonas laurylsulfativorans]|uniref:Acyltransferase n=1 Tax=Pseudomonas laurylsulfativorans TaxID=1943631 RepID=A0A2S3VQD5_9PSED|nr:DapH/DapD/GlmU-related protein [Pseudomonas laurylsulfativorans]POF42168.1 acyltransferase [Pseudomonas laurylsulfativorans]
MIKYELILWTMKLTSLIPGNIGCHIRNAALPYKRGINVKIWDGIHIDSPSKLQLGDNISINRNCLINAGGGVEIGSRTLIGPNVTIYSQNHLYKDMSIDIQQQGYERKPVIIGTDVWIACNAILLPGVTIGNGCVIAAGSVVTHSTPPYTIVAGVPAKVIGHRS